MGPTIEEFGRRWQEIPEGVRGAAERDPHLRAVLRAHAGAAVWDITRCLGAAIEALVEAREGDLTRWAQHLLSVRPGGRS